MSIQFIHRVGLMRNTNLKRKAVDSQLPGIPAPPYKILKGADLVKDYFTCQICYELMSEPVTHSCGNWFCRGCYQKWTATKPTCPSCRSGSGQVTDTMNQLTKDSMRSVMIQCQQCLKENIPLTSWQKHYKEECGSKCVNDGCCMRVVNQLDHNNVCLYFIIKCDQKSCNWIGKREQLSNHLMKSCEYAKISRFDTQVKATIASRDYHRETLAMRHNECNTVGLFPTVRYNSIKEYLHYEVFEHKYNETTEEFTFVYSCFELEAKILKNDHRLVHAVKPNPNANQWEDLQCVLFYIPNRQRPEQQIIEVGDSSSDEAPMASFIEPVILY